MKLLWIEMGIQLKCKTSAFQVYLLFKYNCNKCCIQQKNISNILYLKLVYYQSKCYIQLMNEFTSLSIPGWEFIHRPRKDNDAPAYSISKQFLNFELLIEANQIEMKKTFYFCLLLFAIKSCLFISTTFVLMHRQYFFFPAQ